MNGPLAQAMALVSHGNQALADGSALAGLPEQNSTFRFVLTTEFLRPDQTAAHGWLRCDGPQAWLEGLRERGVRRLGLTPAPATNPVPDHIAVAFAGLERWVIEAERPAETELWRPGWQLAPKAERRERRIWRVTYVLVDRQAGGRTAPPPLASARERLRDAVTQALHFSQRIGTDWAEWFERSLAQLENAEPVIAYHPDMLAPAGVALAARQLVAAATHAWVFGGMGSWNDLYLAERALRAEYERITEELFAAVSAGVCAGVA